MITKENEIEKICSIYASEYHLEMIILPYINKKIDEKAKIAIITEKDLRKTMAKVISKINLSEQRKEEIIKIGWSKKNKIEIDEIISLNTEKELIMFVIGDESYIENINKEIISKKRSTNVKMINCYDFQEIRNNIQEVVSKHSRILNSSNAEKIY